MCFNRWHDSSGYHCDVQIIMSNYIANIDYAMLAGAANTSDSSVTAFGYITGAGGSITNVNLWQPQVAWNLPSAPINIHVASDSANDMAAGTGARNIVLIGVGPSFAAQ